jgi:hypothetical protein
MINLQKHKTVLQNSPVLKPYFAEQNTESAKYFSCFTRTSNMFTIFAAFKTKNNFFTIKSNGCFYGCSVAAISGDIRLSNPRRLLLYCNSVLGRTWEAIAFLICITLIFLLQ